MHTHTYSIQLPYIRIHTTRLHSKIKTTKNSKGIWSGYSIGVQKPRPLSRQWSFLFVDLHFHSRLSLLPYSFRIVFVIAAPTCTIQPSLLQPFSPRSLKGTKGSAEVGRAWRELRELARRDSTETRARFKSAKTVGEVTKERERKKRLTSSSNRFLKSSPCEQSNSIILLRLIDFFDLRYAVPVDCDVIEECRRNRSTKSRALDTSFIRLSFPVVYPSSGQQQKKRRQ